MPNWLGDAVMATPCLAWLRAHFPRAEITVMIRDHLAPLFENDPRLDALFTFQKPSGFIRRIEARQVIERIREGQFDLGLLLTNSFSSAWWFFRGRVKRRIGASGHSRSWLLTDVVKPRGKHLVEQYASLMKPLGFDEDPYSPQLFISRAERDSAKAYLRALGSMGKRVVGIHAAAAYGAAKCWPKARFRQLAEALAKSGDRVLFFGDAASVGYIEEITRGLPVINLAGKTSLRELLALIACMDLFISNDSGPMHVAAAFQVPLVAIFGSTDPVHTGPYKHGVVLREPVACSPCFQKNCPIDFRCMERITVHDVLLSVKRLLG